MGKGSLVKSVVACTLPVLTGYVVLGIGFGILLSGIGLSAAWSSLMAAMIYAGAMQYLSVGLLAGAWAPLSAFLITLIVNARHIFYGFSFLEKYAGTGKVKPYLLFGLTDETFAVLSSAKVPDGVKPSLFYFLVTLFDQCYWFAGCTLGALIGRNLPFDTTGIAFSMTAMFVASFTERMASKPDRLPGVLGAAASAACLFVFGAQNFLLPAMAALIVLFALLRGRMEGEKA